MIARALRLLSNGTCAHIVGSKAVRMKIERFRSSASVFHSCPIAHALLSHLIDSKRGLTTNLKIRSISPSFSPLFSHGVVHLRQESNETAHQLERRLDESSPIWSTVRRISSHKIPLRDKTLFGYTTPCETVQNDYSINHTYIYWRSFLVHLTVLVFV